MSNVPTDSPSSPAPTTAKKNAADFLRFALAQRGDQYQSNTGDLNNPDPKEFDCSGLITWAAVQCGYPAHWPDIGDWSHSLTQIEICKKAGTTLTVEAANQTAGALLFRYKKGQRSGHVAISLGNGLVMHAMSEKMGVNVSTVAADYDIGGFLPDMHFPGPISGLPSGPRGTTGGGFRGATGPVTPIGTITEVVTKKVEDIVTETIADKEDSNMLFLARLDTNPNLWMRGNGVQASRIRAAYLDDVITLLVDPNRGPVYHNPTAEGCPQITSIDDVPLLTAEQMVAHLGDETEESTS